MSIINSILMAFLLPVTSYATGFSHCESSTRDYQLTLEQKDEDIIAKLTDTKFWKMTPIRLPKKSYQILGSQQNVILLKKVTLPELLQDSKLGTELAVALVIQRGELQEDKDMIYPTAQDLYHSLKCR